MYLGEKKGEKICHPDFTLAEGNTVLKQATLLLFTLGRGIKPVTFWLAGQPGR